MRAIARSTARATVTATATATVTAATLFILVGAVLVFGAQKQADWMKYDSPEGRYSILFPAKPELSTQDGPARSGQKLTQYLAAYEESSAASDIVFISAYFDLLPDMTYSFDEARDGYLKAVDATLLSEKPIQLGTYSGRELKASARASGTDLILTAKFYLVEKRVYLLQFLYSKSAESAQTTERGAKFFNSFALVNSAGK